MLGLCCTISHVSGPLFPSNTMDMDDESHQMIDVLKSKKTSDQSDNECESQFPVKVHRSFRTRITEWYSGWRFTLALASFASIIVLAFNLGFVIWAAAHHKVEENRGTLHEGNCEKVQHMSTGLHFAINILSTSLLGASNYCMVCGGLLASPCTAWFAEYLYSNVYAHRPGRI